jgi:hypothetical protein
MMGEFRMRSFVIVAAALALLLTPAAGEPKGSQSSKQYAPGQRQKEPGQAKKFAPGQRQKNPGDAKKFAPGQQGK